MIWWSWMQFKQLTWPWKILYLLLFPIVPYVNWAGERKLYGSSIGESDRDRKKRERQNG